MKCAFYAALGVFIFLGMLFVSLIDASFAPTQDDKNCFNHDNACNQCIREPSCQWCSSLKQGNITDHHCFSRKSDLFSICNEEEIENPPNWDLEMIKNVPLSEVKKTRITDYTKIVQLQPQHIKLKLRKGIPVNFTVSYRQVKDYPLDLYYLMDLSKSMHDDKQKLGELGKRLADTMRNLTSQFKIGFGSFVDKVMLPFVNIHEAILKTPCSDMFCTSPFSFRNNLKLSEDDAEFTKQVGLAHVSSNLDSPEGGFDALMQAMVCDKEIGWRENVRKIIVFSTDALSHTAGDGKLAGVLQPNDGKCHLNEEGQYDKFNEFDYPSIGQIDHVAQREGINIIFAVKGHSNVYQKISQAIKDSVYEQLDASSTNVIDVVASVYQSITGKVEIGLKSTERKSPLSARFFSDCGIPGASKELTNVCNNVKEGSTFNFTVEITVTGCPEEKNASITIGTLQDSLNIDVDLLCDCSCESPDHWGYEEGSQSCSGKGTKMCDVCYCDKGHYGQKCQCDRSASKPSSQVGSDRNKCLPEGSDSTESVCSGRGRCECETCICWKERHYGKFCQCDRARCFQHIGSSIECSGNGRCECNTCKCNSGWEGQFCECESQQNCIAKDSRKLCSENGHCSCGKCSCTAPYTGKYCEECPTCGKGKCFEFRSCVQCQVWGSGTLKGDACKSCNISKVQILPSLATPLNQHALLCTFTDEFTGCDFNFTYKYINEGYHQIFAQSNQMCPQKINIMAVAFGVIGGIVAIGLLTLIIWKIMTTLYDRREYERFAKETAQPQWNAHINKTYIPCTTTVENPAFSAK